VYEWIKALEPFGNLPILLIGTKKDLIAPSDTQAIDNYILDIVNEYENIITYLTISSKTGENIKNAFVVLIGSLYLYLKGKKK